MYNVNITVCKQEIINCINHSIILVYLCQNNKYVTKFTTFDMISKFKVVHRSQNGHVKAGTEAQEIIESEFDENEL